MPRKRNYLPRDHKIRGQFPWRDHMVYLFPFTCYPHLVSEKDPLKPMHSNTIPFQLKQVKKKNNKWVREKEIRLKRYLKR